MISVGDWLILDLAPSGGEHLYDPSKLIGHDHFVIWSDVIGHSPKRIELIRSYSSWMPHRHRVLLDGLSPKINDQSLLGTPMTHLGSFYFQFIFIRIWSWIGICNGTGIWFMWKKGSNSRIRMISTVGSQIKIKTWGSKLRSDCSKWRFDWFVFFVNHSISLNNPKWTQMQTFIFVIRQTETNPIVFDLDTLTT